MRPLRNIFVIAAGLVLAVCFMSPSPADEDTLEASDVIDMIVGDIQTIPVTSLNRVSVTNPDIADISDAKNDNISLLAKRPGNTVLFIWDAAGKRNVEIRVVREDLKTVATHVQKLLQEANISGLTLDENSDIGRVVMTGTLNKDDKYRLDSLLSPYNDSLLDLVKQEKSEDLIQVDMQIVEINTSYEKDLGVLWNTSTTASSGGSTANTSASSGLVTETENIPSTNGSGKFSDFFKIGGFSRSPLQATINAFIQEGKARLISKPRLVVMSGKQASFLVGGEIPIETTTTNTTGSTLTQNTSYTQYGVNVTVTPTLREGKIDILLNVDIRDIDAANSSGSSVAFITRTASTNLFMDNRQTIVLAGLIKYTDNTQLTKVPFLSNIPIVGLLFRNRNTPTPDTNTEMVIILTPMVLTDKKYAQEQVAMPPPAEQTSWNEISAKYPREALVKPQPVKIIENPSLDPMAEMTDYARMVQLKISQAVFYPPSAMHNGLAGTVKLKLHILKDGSLDSEELTESSGNDLLDKDALQAARTAAPFAPFSTAIKQDDMFFTIPIVYNKWMASHTPAERAGGSY